MILSVLITLYVTNLQSKVSIADKCPKESVTPEYAYQEQKVLTLIEIVKAKKENPDITDS
jgi:hypothetical protein